MVQFIQICQQLVKHQIFLQKKKFCLNCKENILFSYDSLKSDYFKYQRKLKERNMSLQQNAVISEDSQEARTNKEEINITEKSPEAEISSKILEEEIQRTNQVEVPNNSNTHNQDEEIVYQTHFEMVSL